MWREQRGEGSAAWTPRGTSRGRKRPAWSESRALEHTGGGGDRSPRSRTEPPGLGCGIVPGCLRGERTELLAET